MERQGGVGVGGALTMRNGPSTNATQLKGRKGKEEKNKIQDQRKKRNGRHSSMMRRVMREV
jgi:hypothetical protein